MTFGCYGYDYDHDYGYGDGCGYRGGYGGGGGGYGCGGSNGCGYGYAYGDVIGVVGGHDAYLLAPWRLLVVGCHAHSLEYWRRRWRAIAAEHGVSINDGDAERLLCVSEERSNKMAKTTKATKTTKTTKTTKATKRLPIVLTIGRDGKGVIFGEVDKRPVPGKPVTLHNARMVLYWGGGGGLFGVMVKGPTPGCEVTRITHAVLETTETVWQEWTLLSDEAAEAWRQWPPA